MIKNNKMKKKISRKLMLATLISCIFYLAIFTVSKIDEFQKNGNEKINEVANAAAVCQSGYVQVADFCIQDSVHGDENWFDAAEACVQEEDGRLCRSAEWRAACEADEAGDISLGNIGDTNEWVDDFEREQEAFTIRNEGGNCRRVRHRNAESSSRDFRCCKNRY